MFSEKPKFIKREWNRDNNSMKEEVYSKENKQSISSPKSWEEAAQICKRFLREVKADDRDWTLYQNGGVPYSPETIIEYIEGQQKFGNDYVEFF